MAVSMEMKVLRNKETWRAFGMALVLFCVIAYSSLSIFGLSSSMYGVTDGEKRAPEFEVMTLNRTGIDDSVSDENGVIRLSDFRGKVVILDFMSVDCTNCHYVQQHIDENLDSWKENEGEYPIEVISIGSWYGYESFDRINRTFGELDSERHMRWVVANGASDSIILGDGSRGDLVEHYFAQNLPLALVVDHDGYPVAKEGTGTPLDNWEEFDDAVELASRGEATDLRFGIQDSDTSAWGVLIIGLFLGVLVYFSPCAFPVLPSYISYCLSLGVREEELREAGKIDARIPNGLEIGAFAAMGQLTFFGVVGLVIFGLDGLINLSGVLNDIAIAIALLLVVLGAIMLLGWSSPLMSRIQTILDRNMTSEEDERFTPRRNMYLWGIGYSAASVDCTAAAVFPFVAWLAVVGQGALLMGMVGLMASVSILMIAVTFLVGMGRGAMIDSLKRNSSLVKATGSWMMIFAGASLYVYLTQQDMVATILD